MIFALRVARAQTATQPEVRVSISEGAPLEPRCDYSYGGTPYLFWCAQHPSQGLPLLLRYFSGAISVQGIRGFEAEFKKSESSFNLRKSSARWSDSVQYFCALSRQDPRTPETPRMNLSLGSMIVLFLMFGRSNGDSVNQAKGQVTLLERDSLTMNCTYSATGYPTLFWYVQNPGAGSRLLLKATRANEKGRNRGFEATYNKEASSFHLEKASVQELDSAVYYCAVSDTVTGAAGGAERKL
ncbi:hypothetical protein MC885_002114 [Smutsia gigantea]|nr:hypothetical protein MC885_002114 [Smutsia gigantea]